MIGKTLLGLDKDPAAYTRDDVIVAINHLINYLLVFSGIVAIIFIIIGGYLYITSLGNEEHAKKAKDTIIWAIIGLVIILCAYVIVRFVSSILLKQDVFQNIFK